jgi:tetratricopeptide (TPR) repeat protein
MRWWIGVAAITVGALALRLWHLHELSDSPLFSVLIGDAKEYDAWAQRIVGGEWLGKTVFYQTPLYPYLMAAIYAVAGHSVFAVRVFQAVIGAASCTLAAIAGRRFFSPAAGLITASLLAVYPPAIFFDGLLQKSSLDLFLVALLLVTLAKFQQTLRWPWLIGVGVTMAAFALNRENARILYPVIVFWLMAGFGAVSARRRVGWAAIATAAAAVVLLPVAVRNAAVGGEFLISTSQLGPNLSIGNHAGASGSYEPLVLGHGNASFERDDAIRLAEDAAGRKLTPGEASDYWFGKAIDFARAEPGAWLKLLGRKLLLLVNAREIVDTESIEAYAEYSRLLAATRWFDFGILLPLAAAGVWFARSLWRQHLVLYASCVGLGLSTAVFYIVARYRHPLVPFVLLFAGYGVTAAVTMLIGRRTGRVRAEPAVEGVAPTSLARSIGPAAAVAAVVAAIANVPMDVVADETFLNVGEALVEAGRPADALPLLRRAAALAPADAPTQFNLGVALSRAGDTLGALDLFTRAVQLRPDNAEAHSSLALTMLESGNVPGAIEHFRHAARLNARDPKTRFNLAGALVRNGQTAEAVAQYEAALTLRPAYPEAHTNLALALRTTGSDRAALPHLVEASRLQPDSAIIRFNLAEVLTDLHQADEALEQYQAAVRLDPNSLDFQYAAAQACARAGRWAEAVAALERSSTLARAQGREAAARNIEAALAATRSRLGR